MIKIAAVTTTRADFGLLSSLLKALRDDTDFDLKLVVTGTHLSAKHGMTINEILSDSFAVDTKISFDLSDDTPLALTISVADFTKKIAHSFDTIGPDAIIILGDRFEMLPIAYTAAMQGIAIIHIHGGELTLGAIDNKMRFAISHLADLHLTATKKSKQRLIDNGISSKQIVFTGAIGVENALNFNKSSRQKIEAETGWQFLDKNILLTFHPETLSDIKAKDQINVVLDALSNFRSAGKFISMPNADPGNQAIAQRLTAFSKKQPNVFIAQNLGHKLYLSMMNEVDVVVGNSSSGIIEAPAFGVATVNIGGRQSGREQANSIIDCSFDAEDITNSIYKAFLKGKVQALLDHPYYRQGTCNAMVSAIRGFFNVKNASKHQ